MRFRAICFAALFCAAALAMPASRGLRAQEAPSIDAAPVFRVFLKDGTALATWGEYAKVGDHLVLTIPIGKGSKWAYEFVAMPLKKVDLPRTESYAEAVRAEQFAKTRGAAEFDALNQSLTTQLSVIQTMENPKDRLMAAEGARRQLIDWANTSHGYRAAQVQQLLQQFDSVIIDLRAAAGESRFSINLSNVPPPKTLPKLMAAPTRQQSISLAIKAAAATDSADTRKSVLATARDAARSLTGTVGKVLRNTLGQQLDDEARIDAQYQWFANDVRREARAAVAAGNARGIEAQKRRLAPVDRKLGRHRPDLMQALAAELDAMVDQAAEHRLALDDWEATRKTLVRYQTAVDPIVKSLNTLTPLLSSIRDLGATPVTSLVRAARDTARMSESLAALAVPEQGAAAQRALSTALDRAAAAVSARRRAVSSRQVSVAREAAAAARESLAASREARAALATLARPPKAQ